MLIQVTTRCDEGCPHCMHRCTPHGTDMAAADFGKVLEVAGILGTRALLISGGEPLLHPDILTMLRKSMAKVGKKNGIVVLVTNFLPAIRNGKLWHNLKLLKKEYPAQFLVQVTADKRFYRSWEEVDEEKDRIEEDFDTEICWEIPTVHTVGRALDNSKALEGSGVRLNEYNGRGAAPMCANPLLAARQTSSWAEYVRAMEQRGKFCFPMVDVYGVMHVSESMCCPVYSDVDRFLSDPDAAFAKLKAMKGCGECPLNSAERYNEMFHLFN